MRAKASYFPLTFLSAALIRSCQLGPSSGKKIQHVAVKAQSRHEAHPAFSFLAFLKSALILVCQPSPVAR